MKTPTKPLIETIETLSVKSHMDPDHHPLTKEEIANALWYLRNYRDLLLIMGKVCEDTEYIKDKFVEDLKR